MAASSPSATPASATGLRNLRDLGGLAAEDGRRVRAGVLLRSEAPEQLSAADAAMLQRIGLRSMLDLRAESEAEPGDELGVLGGAVDRVRCSIREPVDADGRGIVQQVLAGAVLDYTSADLAEVYVDLLEGQALAFGRAVTHIAVQENLPVLVHCRAGKDRTGLVIALLLDAVGVDRQAVLEDYEASTANHLHRRAEVTPALTASGTRWDRVSPLFGAPRLALERAFAHLDHRHGSTVAYLLGPAAVPGAALRALPGLLLEAPSGTVAAPPV